MNKKIQKIIEYAETLLGIKYTPWVGGSTNKTPHPFYTDKIPSKEYIVENGVNCAGFINLLRLKAGKLVPGENNTKGGTVAWYKYLEKINALEKFDYMKDYPLGTLFIRRYRNIQKQGHMAVLYCRIHNENKNEISQKIIHSYGDSSYKGEVGLTPLLFSHFSLIGGFYEFAVLPHKWLE